MKTDFTYCESTRCKQRETCKRYVLGLEARKELFVPHWWMRTCGTKREGYIPVSYPEGADTEISAK